MDDNDGRIFPNRITFQKVFDGIDGAIKEWNRRTERDVKVCPLYSDNEVTEYCVEGPCTDEMEGRCPIAERSEE